MKSILRIITGVIISLAIIIGIIYLMNNETFISYYFNKENKNILNCSNFGKESILNIYKENSKNELVAHDNYLNKSFNFSAIVDSINYNEFTDEPYVMVSDDYVLSQVYFDKSQHEKLKELKKGDKIEFCGTIDDLNPLIGSVLNIKNAILK